MESIVLDRLSRLCLAVLIIAGNAAEVQAPESETSTTSQGLLNFDTLNITTSCAFRWVPMTTEEMKFYWPGSCDRCLLAARNQRIFDSCKCAGESRGYDSPYMCRRNGTEFKRSVGETQANFRERRSLLFRLSELDPNQGSQLQHLSEQTDSRPLIFLGDSTARIISRHLEIRANEVGVKLNQYYNPVYKPPSPNGKLDRGSFRTPLLTEYFPNGLKGLANGIPSKRLPLFTNDTVWTSIEDRVLNDILRYFPEGVLLLFNAGWALSPFPYRIALLTTDRPRPV